MGKNYSTEIAQLPSTYQWALAQPIDDLVAFVRRCYTRPLIAVGSGGSFTSASFAAQTHQLATGCIARAITPLEASSSDLEVRNIAALLLTASGRNPDIRGALKAFVRSEPAVVGVLATRLGGPLSNDARQMSRAIVSEYALPTGKDGYLATNSLLATLVLVARAYQEVGSKRFELAADMSDLLSKSESFESAKQRLFEETSQLLSRTNLLVLYDETTRSAAVDIESRFAEAAFGPVLLSDFRNFAHGRHLWLDRLGSETAVLALVTPKSKLTSQALLKLVPRNIPVVQLDFEDGLQGSIAAVVSSILLASFAGKHRGIDPGQPSVPDFGRKMYHLRSLNGRKRLKRADQLSTAAVAAIQRKARTSLGRIEETGQLPSWSSAYSSFCNSLSETPYAGIAFDYDGTLCDAGRRFIGPRPEVADALGKLLKANVPIAIATGRGRSVREQLQAIIPKRFWKNIVIGYYNGADISTLEDEARPLTDGPSDGLLAAFNAELSEHPTIRSVAKVESRRTQITIEPSIGTNVEFIWDIAQGIAEQRHPGLLNVFRSDHSVDVVHATISKAHAIQMLRRLHNIERTSRILCIGDRGQWPGNDCELLASRGSLSVDETSSDPSTCWNIASPGIGFVDATLEYLSLFDIAKGTINFSRERASELYG